MRSRSVKIGITIVILTSVLVGSIALWVYTVSEHIARGGRIIPTPVGTLLSVSEPEDSDADEPVTPNNIDNTQGNTPENTPDNNSGDTNFTDDPNSGDVSENTPDEIWIDIVKEHPRIARELGAIASEYDSMAVSVVVFNVDAGEYYFYNNGFADFSARREADIETKFLVASLSKLVTAICTMTLVNEGYIDLDSDISNYFGYQVRNVNYPNTRITTRMLLQHTSSIFDSGAYTLSRSRGSSESVRYLLERGASFRRNEPGTLFEYSNFGYAVLGSLCERVSGKSFDTLAREVVFEPLGIDAAFVPQKLNDSGDIAVMYNNDHSVSLSIEQQLAVEESNTLGHDLHLAHGNLTISTADFAKILAMVSNNGELGDVRILSAQSVNEIHKTNLEGYNYYQGLHVRFSVDAFLPGEGFYWHTGSSNGMFSQYAYSTSSKRGVVVVTTGAAITRLESGMIDVCTDLSRTAWQVFE